MTNLIICVVMFYILHLFLVMSFSLHKVPFIQWTYTGGDLSSKTALSERMVSAGDNLRQSLPIQDWPFADIEIRCFVRSAQDD